jgi:hypothetical protein
MHVMESVDLWQRYIDPEFPNWRAAVSDQERRFRLVLMLIAGRETAEAAVTPS